MLSFVWMARFVKRGVLSVWLVQRPGFRIACRRAHLVNCLTPAVQSHVLFVCGDASRDRVGPADPHCPTGRTTPCWCPDPGEGQPRERSGDALAPPGSPQGC